VTISEFESLAAVHRGKSKKICRVAVLRDKVSKTDRVALDEALSMSQAEMPAAAIIEWGRLRDVKLTGPGIASHRAGTCACVGA
jgi:hypothetical protein